MRHLLKMSLSKTSAAELKAMTSNEEIPDKYKVLDYLKSFGKYAYTTQHAIDMVTGEKLDFINDLRTDGVYSWSDSEIYHFEKYNLKLNEDFIQHVLNRP